MEIIDNYLAKQLAPLKENGFLAVCYALLAEALFVGYLGFIALFTIETLLPTFVTVRFSLTKFLFILFLLSFVLALSLYKFPLVTIPLIIAGFLLTGFLFWKILLNEEK
jgi:hypothetical protein